MHFWHAMRHTNPSPGSVHDPLGRSSGRWWARSPSKTNVGNVPGDFIHRVVFFQVCTLLRSIRIYVWIDTLNSARHSAKIRSFLPPRCFRPLPQLDPPVDSARRANDNAVTFAFARERFQVKSEVFFVSLGKSFHLHPKISRGYLFEPLAGLSGNLCKIGGKR